MVITGREGKVWNRRWVLQTSVKTCGRKRKVRSLGLILAFLSPSVISHGVEFQRTREDEISVILRRK